MHKHVDIALISLNDLSTPERKVGYMKYDLHPVGILKL